LFETVTQDPAAGGIGRSSSNFPEPESGMFKCSIIVAEMKARRSILIVSPFVAMPETARARIACGVPRCYSIRL
jgi:hypothetical protein